MAYISPDGFRPGFPSDITHVVFRGLNAAHGQPSGTAGIVAGQPGCHMRLLCGVHVLLQFVVEFTLGARLEQERAKASEQTREASHQGSPRDAERMRAMAFI